MFRLRHSIMLHCEHYTPTFDTHCDLRDAQNDATLLVFH